MFSEYLATRSADRYDQENPCKAIRQFAKGLENWAETFNLLCNEKKHENLRDKIEKVQKRSGAIADKMTAAMNTCED